MKYAYRVWHLEALKRGARTTGRAFDVNEVLSIYASLDAPLELFQELESRFQVRMACLKPRERGVVVLLDGVADSDAANGWIARFLSSLNSADDCLCLVAEPLPRT